MRSMVKNTELQFDMNRLEERRILDLGAKWFLVQDKDHTYVLIRNTILAQCVLTEIEPEGRVVADGSVEFTQNGSWVVPQMIMEYFRSSDLVVDEDSKGFFVTSYEENAKYETEIHELTNRIAMLLE